MKFNYHTMKYEFVDDTMDIVFNEYERKYEYGKAENLGYNVFSQEYTKKTKDDVCIKYNQYEQKYENVPCDWELQYNEYENRYEYAPKKG